MASVKSSPRNGGNNDNIVQFFSNNPKSQKSLWLAKKDCVNAVLEEGDNLDYADYHGGQYCGKPRYHSL